MEIKYEPVFGDQAKLNDQTNELAEVMLWHDFLDPKFVSLKGLGEMNASGVIPSGSVVLAMRRIIRTPTWSVADQKAGKLPEVGCRVSFCHKLNTNWRAGEIKYIDDQVAVIKTDDIDRPFVYEVDRVEFKPIESPEEKAARLRSEWCRKCASQFYPRGSKGFPEMIYDAILSGELSVPVAPEQQK